MGARQLGNDSNKFRDRNSMDAAEARVFGDRQTARDRYSNNVLHKSEAAAMHRHGRDNYTSHVPETDHAVSVKQARPILKRLGLSDQEQKRVLNVKGNLRVTSRHINRQKSGRLGLEVALDPKADLTPLGRARMSADTVTGVASVTGETAYILIDRHGGPLVGAGGKHAAQALVHASNDFATGAVDALRDGAIPLMAEGVRNLCLVAQGEKDFETAARDMGRLSIEVAATGGSARVITSGVQNVLASSSNSVLQSLAGSNQATQFISVALVVKDSFIRYVNGDIDGEQFFREIGEKGVGMVGGMMGAAVGQMLIPIPVIGAMIGSMIVSIVCTEICRAYQSLGEHEKRAARVAVLAAEAMAEMECQRNLLRQMVVGHFARWDAEVQHGFDQLYRAAINDDVGGIARGLDQMLQVVGASVSFKTLADFDRVFLAANPRFKL